MKRGCILLLLLSWAVVGCRGTRPTQSDALENKAAGDTLRDFNICLHGREIFPRPGTAFDENRHLDLNAKGFTLGNAYWFAVISAIVYKDADPWIRDFQSDLSTRLGTDSPKVPTILEFFDLGLNDALVDAEVAEVRSWFDLFFQDSQLLVAEGQGGMVIGFRGTETSRYQDILSDINLFHKDLGGFSGTRKLPPNPGETFGADDSWQYDVAVHRGFLHITESTLPIVKEVMNRGNVFRYTLANGEERTIPFDYLTKEGVLDRLMEVPDDQLETAILSMGSWQVPTPVAKAMVKRWRDVRETELQTGKWHMDWTAREGVLGLSVIKDDWKHLPKPIWTTGHSLGGAVATMFSFLGLREGYNFTGSYTYGSPRVGNNGFARELTLRSIRNGAKENLVRLINQDDVVARVPPPLGIVSPADRWTFHRGARYFVRDDTVPFGVKMWIMAEDIPKVLPNAPLYVRGSGTPREEVARLEDIRAQQNTLAETKYMGIQDRASLADLDRLFPQYLSQLDLGNLPGWIANHSMTQYTDFIGWFAYGESSLCPSP